MSDSLSNKELVAVGHQFAKALSSDTPIIDMAKMFTRLAERLDCTAAALREMTKQRDALGAENAALKKAEPAPFSKLMMEALDAYQSGADDVPELAMLSAYTKLRDGIKTPSTNAFLAEVRAQHSESICVSLLEKAGEYEARAKDVDCYTTDNRYRFAAAMFRGFAAQLRQDAAQ